MINGQDGESKAAGGSGAGKGQSQGAPCVLKLLAPESLASAIIGKSGAVIAAMRTSCEAKLTLTDYGEFYPSTDCRVFTATADAAENLDGLIRQVVAKLAELARGGTAWEAVGVEGELKLNALVPRAAVGGLIGKGGAVIKKIREESGAKVNINEAVGPGPGAEQLVGVSGTAEALEHVLLEVNKTIQLLNTEPWFAGWASGTAMQAGVPSAGTGYASYGSPAIQQMLQVASSMPQYVMEDSRGFAMSCVVPKHLVGGLIGRGGQGTKEVQRLTGAKISIRDSDIPGDSENNSLQITGPLGGTCAAYMLMMRRYLDAEAQASSSSW